jgi:hypothetical protein
MYFMEGEGPLLDLPCGMVTVRGGWGEGWVRERERRTGRIVSRLVMGGIEVAPRAKRARRGGRGGAGRWGCWWKNCG